MTTELDRAAEALGDRARRAYPLGSHTTYRVGGPAALYVEIGDEEDLSVLARAVTPTLPVLVVGNGSNLLVADRGFEGLAVRLVGEFAGITMQGTTVRAGGACLLPVLARKTAAGGLRGLEWAVGVPGSVGGAVRMNAGGHGSEIAATLVQVRLFDLGTGDDGVVPASALDLSYRSSSLGSRRLVLWAEFGLVQGDASEAGRLIAEVVRWRREHQPGGANAGSVFMNPPGERAWRLVEEAGCRGLRVGSAQVSDKHANFIQADEGGSADDVFELMSVIQERVRSRFGIELSPETRLVGFEDRKSGSRGG